MNLTVLLRRTFGDFGMDGFLLFDFSFSDFEGVTSCDDFATSSLLNAMQSSDSKGMMPFLLVTCFFSHDFLDFLFIDYDSLTVFCG